MRRRAFRPEVPNCLEDRSLLSGAAAAPAHPVLLPGGLYADVIAQYRLGFHLYAKNVDIEQLRRQVQQVAVLIPFGAQDGLAETINRTLSQLQQDVADRVPLAIPSASQRLIAATRSIVSARIRAGDVILR